MKIKEPENKNYAACITTVKSIVKLENCDNVVAIPIFGYQAIVQKDTKVGDIGIFFPAETQLSEEYASENNLYRHSKKNKDTEIKGYIEDSRRVKAVKFRGNRSDCLFMPLDSLSYLGVDLTDFKDGMAFEELEGHEICKKYVLPVRGMRQFAQPKKKLFQRVDRLHIPEHFDTDNYFRVADSIPYDANIIVTQKLHGSSLICSLAIVKRKLNLVEKVLRKIGVRVQETEYDMVYSSRKVIRDANNPDQKSFYDSDIWSLEGKKFDGLLPKNYIIYGEIIGWTPEGSAIQSGYTYNLPPKQATTYVYRVAVVNEDGYIVDLSWDQVKEFCQRIGVLHVPEMWRGKKKDFDPQIYLDRRYFDEGIKNCIPLSDKNTVDEGVCVRVDGLRPYIAKAKSPIFLGFETKLLDKGIIDTESQGNIEEIPQ